MKLTLFKFIFILSIILSSASVFGSGRMLVPGKTEADIRNDCKVLSYVSIQIVKQKYTSSYEQLLKATKQMLVSEGYRSSFGNVDSLSALLAASAAQRSKSSERADQRILQASDSELSAISEKGTDECIANALEDLRDHQKNPVPPDPSR